MIFCQHKNLFPIGFLQVRWLKHFVVLYSQIFNKSSGNITFFGYEIGIVNVDLDIINPDDVNFDEDDPETIYL